MKTGRLPTEGNPIEATAAWLGGLVKKQLVDEVMVAARQPGGGVSVAAFADADALADALAWAPVMPVQGARLASRMAFTDPGATVAMVLRPCEARAAVELIKLNQIKPEKLLFITVDCPGTCEVTAFQQTGLDPAEASKTMVAGLKDGTPTPPEGAPLRTACTICEKPSAEWGAIRLHGFGSDLSDAVEIAAEDEWADKIEAAGLATFDAEPNGARAGIVKKLAADRAAARDALFTQFAGEGGLAAMKEAFSTCIRCYNCMENCPICYCKLCIFRSPTFDHPGERYARWAKRKGVQKMPSETTLFHLTRLNHMSSSCVGCGLCDTACPMGLPVATLFRKVAAGVQGMLDYEPGRSLDDPIPLTVFREDELQDESGAAD